MAGEAPALRWVWTAAQASRFRNGSPTLCGRCAPYEAEDDGLPLPQAPIVDGGACSIDGGKPPAPSHLSIACGRGEEPWLEKRRRSDGSASPRKRRGSGMDPRHSAVASLPTRPRMTDFICRRRQLSTAVPGMLRGQPQAAASSRWHRPESAHRLRGQLEIGALEEKHTNVGDWPERPSPPSSSTSERPKGAESVGDPFRNDEENVGTPESELRPTDPATSAGEQPTTVSANVTAPPEGHMRHMS